MTRLLVVGGSDAGVLAGLRLGPADGVHPLRTMDDTFAVTDTLASGPASALIVGAGYVGLEMAETRQARGLAVTGGRATAPDTVHSRCRPGRAGRGRVHRTRRARGRRDPPSASSNATGAARSSAPPLGSPYDTVRAAAQEWTLAHQRPGGTR